MRHFVPLDVRVKKKISSKIYVFDFFFLVGAGSFAFLTQNFVIPSLRIAYIVFVLIAALYLTRPSANNPDKHVVQSMWFYIRRPRTAYIPVETERIRIDSKGGKYIEKED